MQNITRREFVQATAAAGLITPLLGGAPPRSDRPLKLLILGGTGFIGPAIVDAALARGHEMTLFNRGRTNDAVFPNLEKLRGDRDPDKDDGLSALEGRTWDAVIDTSGYVPRHVKASASLLAEHVKHYVFISTVAVYADGAKHGLTETDAVGTIEDETIEEVNGETYGPLKALCEQAVAKSMNGRATQIRPGFIVGPLDRQLNRFPLWVRRVATRDRILCPGSPESPLQLIDSRDLAAFTIRAVEQKLEGAYNAVGPAARLSAKGLVDGLCDGIGTSPTRTWVDEDFLTTKEQAWSFIPWVPTTGDLAGYASVSNAKAAQDGITFRPLRDTARDTLAWLSDPEGPGAPAAESLDTMIKDGPEDTILAEWDARGDLETAPSNAAPAKP